MARPRICVVVTDRDVVGAVEAIRSVQPHDPDLVEVRLDYMESKGGLTRIREATSLPLIATNRRRDQGGLHVGAEEDRIETLLDACEAGFDHVDLEHVDLELTTGSIKDVGQKVKSHGAKLIVSYHDFAKTPEKVGLKEIMLQERRLGADICKIVGTARTHSDNLTYLSFLDENPGANLVCFGMGEAGTMSRVFSPLFGGAFTYASPRAGGESAPGQLAIANLKDLYRLLGV
jgi:3-dehydroquinate dehydratase type I